MFKVRDRVTSIKFGRGTVMCVSPVWVYKVIVQFDNSTDEGSSVMHYTQEGLLHSFESISTNNIVSLKNDCELCGKYEDVTFGNSVCIGMDEANTFTVGTYNKGWGYTDGIKFNYCPLCGREIEGEE